MTKCLPRLQERSDQQPTHLFYYSEKELQRYMSHVHRKLYQKDQGCLR